MEGETQKRPGAEEYLFALIKCAEWVPEEFKQLAEKSRGNTEILKEIYLSACDGVPVEKAGEALLRKRTPEKALRAVRRKFLEESFTQDYEEEVQGIQKKAAALERDVKKMKVAVNDIVERMPTFESAFPQEVEENIQRDKPDEAGVDEEGKDTAENKEQSPATKKIPAQADVPEAGTFRKPKLRWWDRLWERCRISKKYKVRSYIEYLLEAGYDHRQLNYLLDCMERGMTPDEIERIASPNLPVEVMERLRRMEAQKNVPKSGTAEGKEK